MPDCFISYSSVDNTLAQFVNQELTRQGLTVFMASTVLTRIALVRGKYMPVSMEIKRREFCGSVVESSTLSFVC